LQEPGKPVGSLERLHARTLEICQFTGRVGGAETPLEFLDDDIFVDLPRAGVEHPHQQPVTVHRRVPVEAPVERRVQLTGWLQVLVTVHHVGDLVAVFPVNTVQGQPGKNGFGTAPGRHIVGKRHGVQQCTAGNRDEGFLHGCD
jgi:hypothetical protein